MSTKQTLSKEERLKSSLGIEDLLKNGHTESGFPLKIFWSYSGDSQQKSVVGLCRVERLLAAEEAGFLYVGASVLGAECVAVSTLVAKICVAGDLLGTVDLKMPAWTCG